MGKFRELLSEYKELFEKEITFKGRKKFGQVVIAAGGAGSGKGFALDKFIRLPNAKTFDVDALKSKLIKLAKKKGDSEIAKLNLRNPKDVAKLHMIVKKKGIADKEVDAFLGSASKEKLPNIIFDKTAKSREDITDTVKMVMAYGYKPEDIHLVWILTNYKVAFKRNITRSRVVPRDIFLQTHKGAAKTMTQIVKGDVPKNVDGEIYVILNNTDETVPWKKDGDEVVLNTKGQPTPKNFTFIKLKSAGSPIISDKEALDKVAQWANDNVPASALKENFETLSIELDSWEE